MRTVTPNDNLQDALNSSETEFKLVDGVYRLRSHNLNRLTTKKPITMTGSGARKTVILGSDDVRNDSLWDKSGRLYVYKTPLVVAKTNLGGESGYERADYAIDIIADDTPLRHMPTLEDLSENDTPAFHYNPVSQLLMINFIPIDFETLELTRCDRGLKAGNLSNLIISDMTWQNFANPAQQGVLDLDFCQAHIEGVETRLGHGVGIRVGSDSIIRQSWMNDNGQQGVNIAGEKDAYAKSVLIDECRIERNNYAHFKRDVEAGNKFVFTDDLTVRKSYVANNYGHALWLDAGNVNYVIEDNTILDNDSAGIYIEISKHGVISRNFLARNGINRRNEAPDSAGRMGQVWIDTSQGTADMPIEIMDNTFTGDCIHTALRNDKRPEYSLQNVDIQTNKFYGGVISVNDLVSNDLDGRNIRFDTNAYTPDTVAWWGGQPMPVTRLDPNGLVVDRLAPLDPSYTYLPDLDATVPPDTKPLPTQPTQYKIDATITIFGQAVGKIEGTITSVD